MAFDQKSLSLMNIDAGTKDTNTKNNDDTAITTNLNNNACIAPAYSASCIASINTNMGIATTHTATCVAQNKENTDILSSPSTTTSTIHNSACTKTINPGATASASSTTAVGSLSSVASSGEIYEITSHYHPFTDPAIKKLAEQFMSTINEHMYGYKPIKNVTRIDTIKNGALQAIFDQKRAEFIKADIDQEIMAFHGTPSDANIDSISRNNFDSKRLGQTTGNQGWYGSGVYLTKHAGAALRYQYWNTSKPPKRMLMCRVMLGRVFTVPENNCDFVGKGISPGHHSHRGRDRWDADWQIVIFDNTQILPYAHIHYE